jgi:pSer/pThr/pTyr-binding forkhead associated (FHA) protein
VKLRIHQRGQDPIDVVVDKDELTLGRSSDCDVVLANPYISKTHVRLLQGLVVCDLGSINGTFHAGERLDGPAIVRAGKFTIGSDDIGIEILEGGAAPAAADESELRVLQGLNAGLEHELDELQNQNDFLRLQVEDLQKPGPDSAQLVRQDETIEELETLQRDYAELLERLHREIDELLEPAE